MTGVSGPAPHWHGKSVGYWLALWDVPELLVFDAVPSTSDVARTRAESGAPAGLVVLAEHQTAGRGQAGRSWHDCAGSSLLMSILLRPAASTVEVAPGTVPLRVGMAVATALREVTGADIRLKWPNDLVVPGAGKLGGILCEAVNAGARHGYVVAGIGLNVLQTRDDWPDALQGTATSLASTARRAIDRAAVMTALMHALRPLRTAPLTPLDTAERDRFAAIDALRDRRILVDFDPTPYDAAGIAADGALLAYRDGAVRRISSASIRPA